MKTGRTAAGSAFTVENVVDVLARDGAITPGLAQSVLANWRPRAAALEKRLMAADAGDPGLSPIEVLAACDIPSKSPRRDYMNDVELCQLYSRATGVPFARIDPLKLDAKRLCSIVSKPFARSHLLVPVALDGDVLTVAAVNPFDREVMQGLEDVTGFGIVATLGLRQEILKTINVIFAFEHSLQKAEKQHAEGRDFGNLEQLVDVLGSDEPDASDQHIVRAVDLLLQYAFEQRASDIHIEPKREHALVRVRIDGRLHNTHSIPKRVYPSFVSRIKIMSRLDIAEKRRPQDGRIKSVFRDAEIELRVSTVPVAFGEKIVIRIFDPNVLVQDLSTIGFGPEQLTVYQRLLGRPHGIILVTGPTGSGKTTTLYSSLQRLSSPEVNIITIEDPIEMVHEPFNQIAVRESNGVTFANALRSVLRQDPDIIMVGEIRDAETAQYAVQSALTGHLVFSTLHTNTAAGAITRLIDLGVERFLIASTVVGIVAQRLVRLVCTHCDEPATVTDDEMFLLGIGETGVDVSGVRRGAGCEKCRKTGYFGRTAAFEVLEINDRIRLMIRDGDDERSITKWSQKNSAAGESLLTAAVRKMLAGKTAPEELLRVIPLGG